MKLSQSMKPGLVGESHNICKYAISYIIDIFVFVVKIKLIIIQNHYYIREILYKIPTKHLRIYTHFKYIFKLF